jgi:hypothetical protein
LTDAIRRALAERLERERLRRGAGRDRFRGLDRLHRAKAQAGPAATLASHNWAEAEQFGSIFGAAPPAI